MNELTLDITDANDTHEATLLLYIDSKVFLGTVTNHGSAAFFPGLADSAKESGSYLIFTCECGVAGCAGWDKVQVTHTGDTISWTGSYNKAAFSFVFDKHSYVTEVQKMQTRIDTEKIILQPEFCI